MAIIMYHYVRDAEKTPFPEIHGIKPDRFKKQLKNLQERYKIISIEDVRGAINHQSALPPKSCVLSFDDGLKDHYKNVFPILKESGLCGAFFPITMALEGGVANVHKIHFLLAKIGTRPIVSEFNSFLNMADIAIQKKFIVDDKKKLDPRYKFDDTLTANLKVILQLFPEKLKTEFLNKIFAKYLGDEGEFSRELYLAESEIREMSDAGMTIGAHTHSHMRLDMLPKDEMREELKKSKEILQRVAGRPVNIVSYPYGNYNQDTIAILKELGYNMALGTKNGVNKQKFDVWDLKRLNANALC